MNYNEQLKNPLWQKKRLEIMNRDEFQCKMCFSKENSLVVHHKVYYSKTKAWEYEDYLLITLCEKCHNLIHRIINDNSFKNMSAITNISETDLIILESYLCDMIKQQGIKTGIDNAFKLLSSQIIKEDEI